MDDKMTARCGLICADCDYREKMNCPGCVEADGKMFWGECQIAKCCVEKGHAHCGECDDFPCDDGKRFAYDKDQGDDGQRIRNLEQLREQ